MKKKAILSIIDSLEKINNSIARNLEANRQVTVETLIDCQDSAIAVGNEVEKQGAAGEETVHLLEAYCENLYQMSSQQADLLKCRKLTKKIQKQLVQIRNHVKYDLPDDRKQAVFLPYKASMWDSMESVWKAANADPDYDAFVIPIPYYDKNPDGSFREMHDERELFPQDVPTMGYEDYDFEACHPEVVFIHNPYDECNHVTSVHPFFYTKNLKKFSDKIVYIPYFILGENMYESMCVTPGTVYTDAVIAHSARAKEDYVRHLKKFYMENAGMAGNQAEKMIRDRILPLGSPKIDKVVNGSRESYPLPEEWKKKINGKKAVLYNTGVSGILHGNEQELKKIKDTIAFFAGRDDVMLWWRPHPLTGGTMQSMRPELYEEYLAIIEAYKRSGTGIYDDTADLHRAVLWTDMYYGDDSSLIYLYGVQGKPIVRQSIYCLTQEDERKKDKSICYEVSCQVSDRVFFLSCYYNRMYAWNMTDKAVSVTGEAPQELPMETSLYSNIINQDQTLWLVPSRAHALAAYHLDTGKWERYELPDRIKSSAKADGKLYMLSSDYRFLWTMDLEKKTLEKKAISYRQEVQFPLSDGYYNSDLYVADRKIYYLVTHTNLLAVYDSETGEAELLPVGTPGNQYQRLLYNGGAFWFLPNSENGRIACWDGQTVRETDQNRYPDGFLDSFGFLHGVFRDGGLWLFPYKGNMALFLDRETMQMECVLQFDESLWIYNVQELHDGRLAFVTLGEKFDCRIHMLNSENQLIGRYPIVCEDEPPVPADRLFDRLAGEKYGSAYAYQTMETNVYSLSRICDALVVNIGVYGEEQNYFRGIFANGGGNAGERIWDEVKA